MSINNIAAAACLLLVICCFNLSRAVGYTGSDEDAKGAESSVEGTLRSRRLPGPHKITEAVSARDCRRDQLPRYLRDNAPTEPADFLMTTAYKYKPHNTRAFLSTFRRHNREARIIVVLAPDQVSSPAVKAWLYL